AAHAASPPLGEHAAMLFVNQRRCFDHGGKGCCLAAFVASSARVSDVKPRMYDLRFAFDECGFADTPAHIDRSRLFNVSLDLASGDVKLYVLDASERFLYKLTRDDITRQYSGDDREHG